MWTRRRFPYAKPHLTHIRGEGHVRPGSLLRHQQAAVPSNSGCFESIKAMQRLHRMHDAARRILDHPLLTEFSPQRHHRPYDFLPVRLYSSIMLLIMTALALGIAPS